MWAQRPPDFREVFLGGLGGRGARGTGSGKFQEEGHSWVLGQPRPENLMTLHRETWQLNPKCQQEKKKKDHFSPLGLIQFLTFSKDCIIIIYLFIFN